MDKSFNDFAREFPEFYRVTPTLLRASFALEKDANKEIFLDLERGEIKSLHKIPVKYSLRLKNFAKKHKLTLNVIFGEKYLRSDMEKTGNNRLAELYLAKEKLRAKNLEKTASVENKKELDSIEKEIENLELAE